MILTVFSLQFKARISIFPTILSNLVGRNYGKISLFPLSTKLVIKTLKGITEAKASILRNYLLQRNINNHKKKVMK